MCFLHPACLLLSLAAALRYAVCLNGRRAVRRSLRYLLPAALLAALINPTFNHQGATILTYLPSGNPLTLESIAYGLAAALLSAVVTWFSCYTAVMTSDKFMYLFGKVVPAFSLLLSMTLRFVPRFTEQIKRVAEAQQCIGRNVNNGNIFQRAAHGLKILSITTTWALENSVETADSMKSRAYGLRGRTNFSIYRFDRRDGMLLAFLLGVFGTLLFCMHLRKLKILYFPVFIMNETTAGALILYILYGILCMLPLILNIAEDRKWRSLRSEI